MPRHSSEHKGSPTVRANDNFPMSGFGSSAPFETSLEGQNRLSSSDAGQTSDVFVMGAQLSVAAAQRSHSNTLTPAHLMYMAELRIAIAEADARALIAIANTDRNPFVPSEQAQQQRLALNVWEQEGGARRQLRARQRVHTNGRTRRSLND